jgi:uncharacterized membrane protein
VTREPGRADREAAARAHEVAQRAIRRLDMLESVMIAGGAVLALLAGALISWLLVGAEGVGFRRTWIVTSLILFVVPGVIAIFKIRKDRRELAHRAARRHETTRPEEGKRD